eukprot:scaffold26499_cov69-Phaeocystis_antarctica.AAC.3
MPERSMTKTTTEGSRLTWVRADRGEGEALHGVPLVLLAPQHARRVHELVAVARRDDVAHLEAARGEGVHVDLGGAGRGRRHERRLAHVGHAHEHEHGLTLLHPWQPTQRGHLLKGGVGVEVGARVKARVSVSGRGSAHRAPQLPHRLVLGLEGEPDGGDALLRQVERRTLVLRLGGGCRGLLARAHDGAAHQVEVVHDCLERAASVALERDLTQLRHLSLEGPQPPLHVVEGLLLLLERLGDRRRVRVYSGGGVALGLLLRVGDLWVGLHVVARLERHLDELPRAAKIWEVRQARVVHRLLQRHADGSGSSGRDLPLAPGEIVEDAA